MLGEIEIDLPSKDEQKKIIDCIFPTIRKIEINNAINDNLQQQLHLLYDYWFTQFDFPDENGKPYRSSGGKMVWNDKLKIEIPVGWEVKQLGELCGLRNGINYDKASAGDKEYNIVNVRDITASEILIDESTLDKINLLHQKADKYIITADDIIIARSGTPGATRLLLHPLDNTIFCGFIICCTPFRKMHRLFLMFTLKRLEGTAATKTGGSILQNVSQDTLKDLYVPVPPDTITQGFNKQAYKMLTIINHLLNENQQLTRTRDWLLPMLMNGQANITD